MFTACKCVLTTLSLPQRLKSEVRCHSFESNRPGMRYSPQNSKSSDTIQDCMLNLTQIGSMSLDRHAPNNHLKVPAKPQTWEWSSTPQQRHTRMHVRVDTRSLSPRKRVLACRSPTPTRVWLQRLLKQAPASPLPSPPPQAAPGLLQGTIGWSSLPRPDPPSDHHRPAHRHSQELSGVAWHHDY